MYRCKDTRCLISKELYNRNNSTSSLLNPKWQMVHKNSSPNHKSIWIYYDMERSITDALIKENQKVEKEVDAMYSIENQDLYVQDVNSKLIEQRERSKVFQKVNTQIRDLNAELRRLLKTENELPTILGTDIWNSFDAIKGEIIYFKVLWERNVPPLKIKFSKESIDWSVCISTIHEIPTKKNWEKIIERVKYHYYYPSRNITTFNATWINLSVEWLENGTFHLMLQYKSENIKSSLMTGSKFDISNSWYINSEAFLN